MCSGSRISPSLVWTRLTQYSALTGVMRHVQLDEKTWKQRAADRLAEVDRDMAAKLEWAGLRLQRDITYPPPPSKFLISTPQAAQAQDLNVWPVPADLCCMRGMPQVRTVHPPCAAGC